MGHKETTSLQLAKQFLGKDIDIIFDRPLGSIHPTHGFKYEVNYGYVPHTSAPDNEPLDAYYLGVDTPLKKASGTVIAIVHRKKDDDDKLVVVPQGLSLTDEQIEQAITFQEKWFDHEIVRD